MQHQFTRAVRGALTAAVVATVLLPAASVSAGAQGYGRSGYGHAPHTVVAESEWGNGTIEGAVRPGRHGLQVRLPRGTWIDCVRSCSDTLRRQTVDFWESNGPQAAGSGRGYLRWDFRY
ncbi:MAG: hypothetical protein Q8K85_21760 [Hyphomicrobium sp.]|nr:hypothetical protein [Hyphomicrobium sp.]